MAIPPKATNLGLRFKDNLFTKIGEGSWAEKEGLLADDQMVALDGKDTAGMTEQQKLQLFKQVRPLSIRCKRLKYKDEFLDIKLPKTADCDIILIPSNPESTQEEVAVVPPTGWGAEQKLEVGDIFVRGKNKSRDVKLGVEENRSKMRESGTSRASATGGAEEFVRVREMFVGERPVRFRVKRLGVKDKVPSMSEHSTI